MNIFDFFSKFKDFDNITDFRSVPSCQFFSKVVDYGINTGKDFQFYEIYCDAIIETINQGVPEKFKLRLQLSQFQSASICLNILMSQKNFHKMYDLVVKAFSDVRVVEKENAVAYDKIDIFFKAKILNNSDFIRFLFPLFYYDESNPKVFSHICEDFKEHYKAVLYYHLTNGHMEYLREVLGLLSWAVNRDAAFLKGDFWNKVKYIYDENILSCEDHAKVGVALVTNIGVVYGVNVKNNAYELYKNFHQCLGAHEVLQVLLSIVSHDYNELLKYKKDILYEVAKYYAYLDHKNLDEYAFFYERSRIFSAIYIYYILTALEASDEVLASELYYFWENKGQEIERIPKSLIIIPNRSDELIIGKTRISSKQHDADLSDLINIQNQCLQLQELNNIDPKVEMVKAERLGVPNEKLGGKYLAQLQKFYKFSKWPDLTGYEDYLLLNNTNHPIQSLCIKNGCVPLPHGKSSYEIIKDRDVKKVLFWYTTATFTSELELKILEKNFTRNGVEFFPVNGDSETNVQETFIKSYCSEDYDVVWIAGHGEVDKFKPQDSKILLSNEIIYDIRELPILAMGIKKRLLVLNLCNSGNNFSMGGVGDLGMSFKLASPMQYVIGHLWPINPIYSLCFSLALSEEICKTKNNFFESYLETLKVLQSGKDGFLKLSEKLEMVELNETIERSGLNYDSITNWGSSIFIK